MDKPMNSDDDFLKYKDKLSELKKKIDGNEMLRMKLNKMTRYLSTLLEGRAKTSGKYSIRFVDKGLFEIDFHIEGGNIFGKLIDIMICYCEKQIKILDKEIESRLK